MFNEKVDEGSWLFVQTNLQKYLLMCCQDKEGGMKDKPRKHRDFYHTCYALSGLSVSQYNRDGSVTVFGEKENLLVKIIIRFCKYSICIKGTYTSYL